MNPLRHQLPHRVFDLAGLASVPEALRHPTRQVQPPIRLPQQQRAAVGTQMTGVESSHHVAVSEGMKLKLRRSTLCAHGTSQSVWCK